MSTRTNTLNEQLIRLLECPVCLVTCEAPIYRCLNGHTICNKCQPQLRECEECRAPGKPTLRSFTLEKIAELVEMPCPNKVSGCTLSLAKQDMLQHLPECEHGCECLICRNWKGPIAHLYDHVFNKHYNKTFNLTPTGTLKLQLPIEVRRGHYVSLCNFAGSMFWLDIINTQDGRVFSFAMRLISNDPTQAASFCFRVKFSCFGSGFQVTYGGDVFHLKDPVDSKYMEFVIPAAIIDSNKDVGDLSVMLSVMKKPLV